MISASVGEPGNTNRRNVGATPVTSCTCAYNVGQMTICFWSSPRAWPHHGQSRIAAKWSLVEVLYPRVMVSTHADATLGARIRFKIVNTSDT